MIGETTALRYLISESCGIRSAGLEEWRSFEGSPFSKTSNDFFVLLFPRWPS